MLYCFQLLQNKKIGYPEMMESGPGSCTRTNPIYSSSEPSVSPRAFSSEVSFS